MAGGRTAEATLGRHQTVQEWAKSVGVDPSAVERSGNHVWTYAQRHAPGAGITAQAVLGPGETVAQWAAQEGIPNTPGAIYQGRGGHVWTYATRSLTNPQQSAFDLLNQTLRDWGLTSLSGELRTLIQKGDTNSDTLTLQLSQTPEWKQRFSGNDERIKNGLAPLSPAQYLAAEESYKQVLKSYGIPPGFYDTQAALAKYIGGDVSASELDARAKDAHDTYMAAPQYMKDLWGQYFGTKGDAIAGILDPKTATQVINDRALQVQIGGAAAAQGLHINQARAQQFQQAGVTAAQAQNDYSKIAASLPLDQQIADRFHTQFGQTQEENDLLLGQGAAARQRQTLYGEEQGLFEGHAGANAQSIGVSQYR